MKPKRAPLARQAVQIPNLITYARIAAIPLVLVLMRSEDPRNAFIAAMTFAGASATDALDGYLARKYNLTSLVGKFLDPLADKLIVMGTLVMLIDLGRVATWIVLVILARETIITGLRTIAAGEGLIIQARDLGKQKTALQMVGIWCLLVEHEHSIFDFWGAEPLDFNQMGLYFLYLSILFSLLSAGEYFWAFFKTVAAREATEAQEGAESSA